MLALLLLSNREYIPVAGKRIHWPGARDSPPPDVPKCGFLGNALHCQSKHGRIHLLYLRLLVSFTPIYDYLTQNNNTY